MRLITKHPDGLHEQEAEPVFEQSFDVVVAGGGTAGTVAAICLAQKGVKTLVIERLNALGGTFSHSVFGYYFGSAGGYYEQLDRLTGDFLEAPWMPKAPGISNPEARKHVSERLFLEADGEIAFAAMVSGVYAEGRTIVGLQYLSGESLRDVACKIAIDATAEAYLAELARCRLIAGRDAGGVYQPYSNVATSYREAADCVVSNNMDAGYADPFDVRDYSHSIVLSAAKGACLWDSYPQSRVLLTLTPLLGLREGKRIVGEEVLRLDEWMDGKTWDKPVFYAFSNIDNHGKDIAFESGVYNDWTVALSLWGLRFSVGVPMGALISRDYDNLLAAGRLLSQDHDFSTHVRMMRDMQKCGEAAAAIACQALAQSCACKDADYAAIGARLRETGCLDNSNDVGLVDYPPSNADFQPLAFPKTAREARALMSGPRPGLGMLFMYRQKQAEALIGWLGSGNERLRVSSAFTLALLDDASGADILMELARARSMQRPLSSRKYNALYGVSAIYLLGRLGHLPAEALLFDIIEQWDGLVPDRFLDDEFMEIPEDFIFQFVSHAVRALLGIARRHPLRRDAIRARLESCVLREGFRVKVSLKAGGGAVFDMTDRLRRFALSAL